MAKNTCDSVKAHLFCHFFSSVIISEDTRSLPSFTLNNPPPSISKMVISPQSVFDTLKLLKVDKSPGPDGWLRAALNDIIIMYSIGDDI